MTTQNSCTFRLMNGTRQLTQDIALVSFSSSTDYSIQTFGNLLGEEISILMGPPIITTLELESIGLVDTRVLDSLVNFHGIEVWIHWGLDNPPFKHKNCFLVSCETWLDYSMAGIEGITSSFRFVFKSYPSVVRRTLKTHFKYVESPICWKECGF